MVHKLFEMSSFPCGWFDLAVYDEPEHYGIYTRNFRILTFKTLKRFRTRYLIPVVSIYIISDLIYLL